MENSSCATRTALLHAALACFAENGYEGTSIRMIADRAQRPLSLLAHHFKNKEGLYIEVFKFIFEHTLVMSHLHSTPGGGCTPRDKEEAQKLLREQFQDIFTDVTRHCIDHNPIHEYGSRLWLQELRSARPTLTPIFNTYVKPFTETIRKCIQVLRPDLEEAAVAVMGISMIGMIASHGLMRGLNQVVWENFSMAENHPRATEWLTDLCLDGLLGSGAHPPEPAQVLYP